MTVQMYLDRMKEIQNMLLCFLDAEVDIEESYQEFVQLIEAQNIKSNKSELKSFMHLLLKISKNHHRHPNIFDRIDQVLRYIKDDIQKYFSNREIFTVVKGNKRLLLFFIKEKILKIDRQIINQFKKYDFYNFFFSECKEFIEKSKIDYITRTIPADYENCRQIGENHTYLCKLIREDSIKDFIKYVNKENICLSSNIEKSFFETNSFLVKQKNIDLIEYATFFGSIQIFNYLRINGIELKSTLPLFAIHGNNAEIIHLLEDLNLINNKDYFSLYAESIKCFHNDIADYFLNKILLENDNDNNQSFDQINYLKYYNFSYLQSDLINQSGFYDLCHFDYPILVKILLSSDEININVKKISIF